MTVVAYKQLQPKYDVKKLSELTLMIRFWLSSGKGDFGIYSYVFSRFSPFLLRPLIAVQPILFFFGGGFNESKKQTFHRQQAAPRLTSAE